MPLYENRKKDDYSLALWEAIEELTFFLDTTRLSNSEFSFFKRITNEKRKREWIIVRYLLQNLMGISQEICYSENGKPSITSQNISISHSGRMVALILSNYKCAIDIEQVSQRISKISHKAFSANELSFAHSDEELTVLWCVKESVFKLYGNGDVDFRNDIAIDSIKDFNSGVISCRFLKKNVLLDNLNLETIGNYKMVWVVDNLDICNGF